MKPLSRVVRALPLLVISPVLMLVAVLAIAMEDLLRLAARRPAHTADAQPSTGAATVVIPNWNGKDLLEKYLPSVQAALDGNPDNELIVVDNGSYDGSVDFLRANFPAVRVIALERNLGFGGGSNAGFLAAKNDIVVLLNSDMRVDRGFLRPLLEGFGDPKVFAVSCQIFFTDSGKLREESGLTQGWWQDGGLRVRHRIDAGIEDLYPCFYGGGGSCAFDKRKFLGLGGFDSLLEPFYLEDTDLGYMAWKRGWKLLYQPRSIVYHEHRGTIGKRFTDAEISAALKKNYILFCWKNIHEWPRLASHFFFAYTGALLSVLFGDAQGRPNLAALWRAFRQLPQALRSRWRAQALKTIPDTEAFLRPMGGYFRDRFSELREQTGRTAPVTPLQVLFVSPYPICPPVHGGGVFMYGTLRELVKWCDVHVIALLESPDQETANDELRQFCASAEFLTGAHGEVHGAPSVTPHAVREFAIQELDWLIHRQIYTKRIDVLQLEYTPLAQYAGRYRNIASILFEHDIYFQSIARGLPYLHGFAARAKAAFEYLRALRYELRQLPGCDRVQVCTPENRKFLAEYLPQIERRIQAGLRAGIDTSRYTFQLDGRAPFTLLFLGSFRHMPNQIGLDWFVKQVLPAILVARPQTRLVVAGSDPPPRHGLAGPECAIELLGFVEDIRVQLERCAVFVCPVLSGSGVRVKLLEAFACGIPVVSTRIGAEGLAETDGQFCALADEPEEFARKVVHLLDCTEQAHAMARRARAEVETNWDMAVITQRLAESYREAVAEKRGSLFAG